METEGLVQLEGAAAENEDAYVDVWKYSIQGYESDDEIESNIYYTVLNAAVSEWMDAAGDFPVDEDWNYLPEFLEYVNDCTPYTIENIKFTGEERIYTLLGKEVPDHPDRLEKPDINEYVDAWRDRVLRNFRIYRNIGRNFRYFIQNNCLFLFFILFFLDPVSPEEPDQPKEPENPDPSEDTDQTENESGGSMEEDKEDTEEKDASSEETLDTEENSDTEESL